MLVQSGAVLVKQSKAGWFRLVAISLRAVHVASDGSGVAEREKEEEEGRGLIIVEEGARSMDEPGVFCTWMSG